MARKDKLSRMLGFEGSQYRWPHKNPPRFSEVNFYPSYIAWCVFLNHSEISFLKKIDIYKCGRFRTFFSCEQEQCEWGNALSAASLSQEGTCLEQDLGRARVSEMASNSIPTVTLGDGLYVLLMSSYVYLLLKKWSSLAALKCRR